MARRPWSMKRDLDADGKEKDSNAVEAYEEYLLLLQQRNRLLAKLKEKDEKQLELERREQGFSLYLNGANVGLHLSGQKSKQPRTAGEYPKREVYKSENLNMGSRAKTAPTKTTRKGWDQVPTDAIKIKTEKGDKVRVDSGVYSGKYSEDFEMYESCLQSTSKSDGEMEDDYFIQSDDYDYDIDEESDDELTFTVQDVKALRVSLENDLTIRKSIASVPEELSNSDTEDKTILDADDADISEELITYEENNYDGDEDSDNAPEEEELEEESVMQLNAPGEIRELTPTTVKPKARPISASRKRTENSTVDPTISEDVSAAIAEENKRILEYQQRRKTKTAPTQASGCLPKEEIEVRPVTISSTLTDGEIVSITQRVRALTGRQQKKLLNMLCEIDSMGNDLKDSWDYRKDKNKQYLEEEKNDRKNVMLPLSDNIQNKVSSNEVHKESEKYEVDGCTSININNQVDSIESKASTPSSLSCEEMESFSRPTSGCESLEVKIELVSNWGNESFIGLTEIQFIDCANKHIKVYSDDLNIFGASGSMENLKNLVNSKTKTTKEKYMWKCNYSSSEKIKLTILLQNCEYSKLGKILIWNYNRNLQELNIGVKSCNVYISGELKWQGLIEKGCGNQIFDYSTVIPINMITKSMSSNYDDVKNNTPENVDDKTVDKVKTPDRLLKSPVAGLTSEDEKSSMDSVRLFSDIKSSRDIKSPMHSSGDLKGSVNSNVTQSLDEENSQLSKLSNVKNTSEKKKRVKSSRGSPSIRTSSSMSGKPVWLEESSKVKELKDNSDLFLEGKKVSLSTPPSVRRSLQNTPDFIEPAPSRRPISGRRSQLSSADEDSKVRKEMEDLFDMDSMPRPVKGGRKNVSIPNRRHDQTVTPALSSSPLLLDMPKDHKADVSKSERTKFRELVDTNLEQSLQSINNFNFRHLGRITASIDDENDDLMSLLEPMKQKDLIALQDKTIEPEIHAEEEEVSDVLFELPVLPKGKDLIINIKSTWGDRHYVGLNGIEVFSKSGHLIKIKNIQADPADINVLPEFDGDPRVVTNLIDCCYLTRDDLHLWLTPFTEDGDHFLELEFEEETEIAMIRIWNYNKSRIHSTRGARFVEMALDGKLIFIGEIARASGVLSSEDPYGDTILFTTDENILLNVANNDFTYEVVSDDDEDVLIMSCVFGQRPSTADKTEQPTERPFTCPKSRQSTASSEGERNVESPCGDRLLSPGDGFIQCKVLTVFFCETWADQHYVGLTGLEVLGETFESIPLELGMLEACPRDLNDLQEYDDDDRTLDKLLNGINVTTSDENMWMIPFDENGTHVLKITFDDYTIVTGLRVWNYNKSLEDTFRGAKTIHVYLDDHVVSPQNGFLLRKGPGHCHFDFAQDVLFNNPDAKLEMQYPESSKQRKINIQNIVNEYETLMMPNGFVFQLKLFSSWGDQYYMGLNGIEVYDKDGEKINLSDNNVTAYPHSVNILDGVDDDVRTPDKLVNGLNDTYDGRQMWLAPILPGQDNIVYIVFDEPITISMVKLWNYSKTPARGVRNFGLLVDDLLVYSGVLPQPLLYSRAILPGIQYPVMHHTILFTDNEAIALKERKHVLSSNVSFPEQNVQLTNDRAILNPYKDKNEAVSEADPEMRPMTSVTSISRTAR